MPMAMIIVVIIVTTVECWVLSCLFCILSYFILTTALWGKDCKPVLEMWN